MKTKEEIIRHIQSVGYSKIARKQICAFMVGAKLKEKNEVIKFLIEENKSFDDFMDWYDKDMPFDVRKQELIKDGLTFAESLPERFYKFYKLNKGIQDIKIGNTVCFGFDFEKKIHTGVVESLYPLYQGEYKILIVKIKDDKKTLYQSWIECFDFIFPIDE